MRYICLLLGAAMIFSLCAVAVLADNTGPMDSFDDLFPRGDVDGDGRLHAKDYMKLKRAVLSTYKLTPDESSRADINSDGKINGKDYMMLKRAILGKYVLV